MKGLGRVMMGIGWVAAGMLSVARADDPKDSSGKLVTWTVTVKDGAEAIGTESLRIVESASGSWFASGEVKLKGKTKLARKSHQQRDGSGRLTKYQRVEAGLKGPGVKLFDWQGQTRWAPVNGSGKPVDVGTLSTARIWDAELWHLYQTWGLPKSCETTSLSYFDPDKREAGKATLKCVGSRKVYDDKKKAVDVHALQVTGVPGESVELWVDAQGQLIGAKGASRAILRTKYALEPGKNTGETAPGEDDAKEVIKDRGVGE